MDNVYGMGVEMEYVDNGATNGLITLGDAFDSARSKGNQFVNEQDAVNQAISGLGQMAGILTGVGAGLIAFGDKAIDTVSGFRETAKSYESQLATLKYVTQASGEEWEALTAKAEEAGIATQFSPDEAVEGLYELASAGLNAGQAINALDATLDFATMSNGMVSVADSASLIAQTMNKFNLSATEEQVMHIADVFATASIESMFKPEQMASFVNSLGAMPASLGVSLEEVTALGSLLVNIGQGSAQAGATVQGFGRKIKMITSQIQSGSMKGKKADAMELLGIDSSTFWTAEGNLRSMVDIFNDIATGAAGLSDEMKASAFQTLFGDQATNLLTAVELSTEAYTIWDEAAQQYIVDPNSNAKKSLDQLITAFKDCDGVVSTGADTMEQTSAGLQKLAEGSLQTLQIKLGEVTPAFDNFANKFKIKFYNALISLIDKHPKLAKAVVTIIGLAGGISKVAGIAVLGVAGLMGLAAGFLMLSKNMGAIKTGMVAFKSFITNLPGMLGRAGSAMGGLMLKMLPMALAIGAIALAWKTDFLGIKTTLLKFVDNVKGSWNKAKELTSGGLDNFLSETRRMEESGNWWDWLSLKIMDFMLFFQGVSDAWSDYTLSDEMFTKLEERGLLPLIEKILDFKLACEEFIAGFKTGWQEMNDMVTPILEAIGKFVGDTIMAIGDLLGFDWEFLGGSGINTQFWNDFGHVMGLLAPLILAVVAAVKTWSIVQGIFNAVMSASPITWIIVAIVALIAVIALCVKHWDDISAAAGKAWDWICGVWNSVADWFNTNVIQPVVGFFQGLWDGIVGIFQSIVDWVVNNWQSILLFIINPFAGVFNYLYTNFEGFREFVNGIVSAVVGFFVNAWESIKAGWSTVTTWFSNVWTGIKNVFASVGAFFTSAFTTAYNAVTSAFSGIVGWFSSTWNSIVSGVKGFVNQMVGAINGVIGRINNISFTVPDWVPGIGGNTLGFNIPKVPTLAVGTDNWQGGVAQISEKGGEIVDLPSGSRVYPHDETVQRSYQDGASNAVAPLLDKIDKLIEVLANMGKGNTQSSQVVFEAGSIVAKVDGASVADLEELVEQIMEIIRRKQQLEGIRNYA